jgi:hypothetical protein
VPIPLFRYDYDPPKKCDLGTVLLVQYRLFLLQYDVLDVYINPYSRIFIERDDGSNNKPPIAIDRSS